MATQKTERRGFLLHLNKACTPVAAKDATVKDLKELLEILNSIYKSGKHFLELNGDGGIGKIGSVEPKKQDQLPKRITRGVIYIADLHFNKTKNTYSILFAKADASVSNPAFLNTKNNKVRVLSASDNEAVGFSAHLRVSLDSAHKSSKGYRAVLEKANNLSRTLIFNYIEHLLEKYSRSKNLNYVLRNKAKDVRPYRISLSCEARASASLKKDVTKGSVTMIKLIDRQSDYAGWDSNSLVSKVTREVKLSVDFPRNSTKFLPFFKKISEEAKLEQFDEISIKIGSIDGSTSATPNFSLEKDNAADILYSRIVHLGKFVTPLEQCYTAINKKIEERLTKALEDKDNW